MIAPPTYAVCLRCKDRMTPGTSCCECPWHQEGREIPPIRFGSEKYYAGAEHCRDCGAPVGGTHHYGCTIENCPHGRQAITCDRCPVLDRDPYYSEPRAN